VIGIVGLMKTSDPVGIDFKNPGRSIVLIGGIGDCDLTHFGGTQYASVVLKQVWGLPPALDMDYEKRVHAAIREIVTSGLVESAHDVGEGGLAVALAESSFGPADVSAKVDFNSGARPEFLLFHEAPSRVIVSTSDAAAVQAIAAKHGVIAPVVGTTQGKVLSIAAHGKPLLEMQSEALRDLWENALPGLLKEA
jgi:phosphoribosylformylglycinamidine synthase